MARIRELSIENYKSVGEQITIKFPDNAPVVLIGENNTGKSNISRALELLFGDFHPGYKDMDDHDHFDRDPRNKINIEAYLSGVRGTVTDSGRAVACSGVWLTAQKGMKNVFGGFIKENGNKSEYVKADVRSELKCVVVNSEYSLSHQLSYASKYTLLSKLTKSFHQKLTDNEDNVQNLKVLYEGIKKVYNSVSEFEKFQANMSTIAGSFMQCMTHALKFDFSAYDPSNYFKSLRVNPIEGELVRTFEELGSGQQQILALAFAQAYADHFIDDGLLFVFDEPEVNLHPLAQDWLAEKLTELAKSGIQILITTHSPYFLNLLNIESLYIVRKNQGQTYVKNLTASELMNHCLTTGVSHKILNESNVVNYYAYQATREILKGFFAKKIVLVEGRTEELALPVWLKKVGLNTLEEGIDFINVHGKPNLAKWWRFFTAYNIPTYVVFDIDHFSKDRLFNYNKALKDCHFPEDQVGSVLSDDDWNMSDRFLTFGYNFEVTLRNSIELYWTRERELEDFYGTAAKHVIAKECARTIKLSDYSGALENFTRLKEILLKL